MSEGEDGAVTEAASDVRKTQMLRAAVQVIAERGFPETRIADIGRRVGASSALVIYYFGTKDRLLTEALRFSEDLFYAEVARRLDGIDGAAAKIEALVVMSCSADGGPEGLPGSWQLWPDMWSQAARHPEVSRDREELDQRWRDKVAEIVRAGIDAGELSPVDVDQFTLLFTALLDGLAVQVGLGDPVVTSERATEVTMRFVAAQLGFAWERPTRSGGRPGLRRAAGAGRRRAGAR